jgi:hygromycin-B 7''-O-kinase
MRLPQDSDPVFFDQVFRLDLPAWRVAVVEVCAAHDLECASVAAYADGSNLVAAVDNRWIVKIFPPFHRHQWESEHRVLARLQGEKLPLRVPLLIAVGTRSDGWFYVITDKLPGVTLETCWDQLGAQERARVLEQIGSTMATIHRLPLGELSTLPPEWSSFLSEQKLHCRKRHLTRGAPPWFEQGLEDLLRKWATQDEDQDRVLLTGEYTPFNLLAQRDATGWQLTGMIDYGDAMVGPADYDLLGPAMFSCRGDSRLIAALLRGYFGENCAMTEPRRMRLMALAVLHRYANFDVQLCIPGWRERADSFESLAELVWP